MIVTPIGGFYNCSILCCVHSSFAIISMGKRELVAFALFVFLVSHDCFLTLLQDATGLSEVFDYATCFI